MRYKTGIKDASFKFYADNRSAEVSLNFEMKDAALRQFYFEKLLSLENILRREFLSDVLFSGRHFLDNGKEIAKIWVPKEGINIYKKDTWRETFEFFVEKMSAFEEFYVEYQDFIKDV